MVITTRVEGGIGHLILDRPAKLNAMGDEFWRELPQAAAELDLDNAVGVIIVSANGPHFSSGLDLAQADLNNHSPDTSQATRNLKLYEHIKALQEAISSIAECSKPTIAAIHGLCIGGGVDLISACDMRLCSPDAIFSIRETKIAIVADLGSLQRLPRIMPLGPLYELALTGRDFSADEARAWGLVNSIARSQNELLQCAIAMAHLILENSPLAVYGTKEILRQVTQRHLAEDLDRIALWNAAFLRSNDLNEAFTAYSERRSPNYRGT